MIIDVRAGAPTLRLGKPEEVGMSSPRIRHLAEQGEEWVREKVAPAMVLLAARRGRIVLHVAFGYLTPDADSPATPLDGLFPLASITKLFTTTALMVLVEEGRVGLNRPVSGYIPEFQAEGKDRVLVRHLLTHTSGINEEELEKYAKEVQGKIDIPRAEESLHPILQEYLTLRYLCPLWKPPGEEMSYADFNFELAAEIVRRVSRTPLDRFSRARIFQPLGMNDSYYCRVDAPPERRVRRAPVPGAVSEPWAEANEKERLCWGSGGALSTAMDLAVFGQMFLNSGLYGSERVLSPASVAAMTRNQIPGVGAKFVDEVFREASWGLGWSVHGPKTGLCGGLHSAEAFEHWGNGGGYLWIDPATEIVGVYLSSAPVGLSPEIWADHWRTDIFTDAVTAAVVEP
jgi:CubicO group peptidase (beta-lactamase class C family)